MIAWLEGVLLSVKPPIVVLNVGGVGYELEAPMSTIYDLPAAGEKISVFTHMVVREDAQLLYGFRQIRERDIFRELLKISGVGPKVALAILSTMSVEGFFRCISQVDITQLVAVPGIGKKTAERLMVEMKNRFADQLDDLMVGVDEVDSSSSAKQDAIGALLALGYKQADASRVLNKLDLAGLSSEQIIRQALQVLSGRVL
ncbi:MAG: Holliday junction branch migration protein RuvA [Arenicella sp.]